MNIAQIKNQLQASKFSQLQAQYESLNQKGFLKALELAEIAGKGKKYYFQAKKSLKQIGIENLTDFSGQIFGVSRMWLDNLVSVDENRDKVQTYLETEKVPTIKGFLSFLRPKKDATNEPETGTAKEPAKEPETGTAKEPAKEPAVTIKVVVTINGTESTIEVPETSKLFAQIMREIQKTAN